MATLNNNENKKEDALSYFQTGIAQHKTDITKPELRIDEFRCPSDIKQGNKYTISTQYCENKAMNSGCKELETCKAYKAQKALRERFPELNWKEPELNTEQQISTIAMIKKGQLQIPKGVKPPWEEETSKQEQ